MELWFREAHTPNVKLSIRVDKQLYSGQSEFQRIDVFDSQEFGRFLTLDGYMMLTEKDEFIYHEMMVHIPMAVHPNVKDVLVIGGGDGGVVRSCAAILKLSISTWWRSTLRWWRCAGAISPSPPAAWTTPVCPSTTRTACGTSAPPWSSTTSSLWTLPTPSALARGCSPGSFYGNCSKALRADGIMVNQHESPFYQEDAIACQRAHKRIVESFPLAKVYQAHIPTYPSGHWLFGFASKKYHPQRDLDEVRWNARKLSCKYYTTMLHKGAFYIPAYVEELLKNVESAD